MVFVIFFRRRKHHQSSNNNETELTASSESKITSQYESVKAVSAQNVGQYNQFLLHESGKGKGTKVQPKSPYENISQVLLTKPSSANLKAQYIEAPKVLSQTKGTEYADFMKGRKIEDLIVGYDQVQIGKTLGDGNFGVVALGTFRNMR